MIKKRLFIFLCFAYTFTAIAQTRADKSATLESVMAPKDKETMDSSHVTFQFALLSDIHLVKPGEDGVIDLYASVNDINSNKNIRFTIITGDIADFGEDSVLELAKRILDKLDMPYYIVPGNHDTKWSESGASGFDKIFGHHNISFNYGKLKFVGFQVGPILRRGDGYISPSDFDWVKSQCEQAKKEGRIVIPFDHYPLAKDMSNWNKLTSLFRKYEVPMILSGHWHRYALIEAGGIPNVVTRTNRTWNGGVVGYTIVNVTADSMFFNKREPTLNKTIPWIHLSYQPANYNTKDIQPFIPDFSVNKKYPQVKVTWKQEFPAGISSEAVYTSNKILVGDRDGILHCLSLNTGKQLWEFKTGNSIFSTPAISDGKVVFGSVDSYIYCVSLKDGELLWKFKTDNYVLGCPAIENNIVYIGASDWKFRTLDLNTGKLIWVFDEVRGWIQTKPVVYKDNVYFGAWDNYFYALDKTSGKLIWKWARSSHESYPGAFYAPAACWPVAANDKIFIAGPDMIMTAFNAQSGDTLWRIGKPKLNEALGMSEDGSKVFVKGTFDSTLLAYSTVSSNPQVLWETKADYGFDDNESPIAEKDGVVYFTFRNGMIIAAKSETGEILWQHRLGEVMLNGATPISANEIIVSDVDGNLLLLRTK